MTEDIDNHSGFKLKWYFHLCRVYSIVYTTMVIGIRQYPYPVIVTALQYYLYGGIYKGSDLIIIEFILWWYTKQWYSHHILQDMVQQEFKLSYQTVAHWDADHSKEEIEPMIQLCLAKF